MGKDRDSLAMEVVSIYFQNCSVVEHLAKAYGFEFLIVWQPVIWCGDKELTEHELGISSGSYDFYPAGRDSALISLLDVSYGIFEQTLTDTLHYLSLSGVFDSMAGDVYTDHTGVHIDPDANGIIASVLLEAITEIDPELSGLPDSTALTD